MKTQRIARLLREIADSVAEMNEEEFDAYLRALVRPGPRPKKAKSSLRPAPKSKSLGYRGMQETLNRLQHASSREEADSILKDLKLTRNELMQLARLGEVHTTKEDTVAFIEMRLVEALVGARLSSKAIRGE